MTVCVFDLVEDFLVLVEEAPRGIQAPLPQPAGVLPHEPGDVVAQAQPPIPGTGLSQFLDLLIDARTQLCLRHAMMVTAVTKRRPADATRAGRDSGKVANLADFIGTGEVSAKDFGEQAVS